MAFSTIAQPIGIQPAYNRLEYIVLDPDYITEVDFKYVFKTYVGTTLVDTSKIYPSLDTYGRFDASKILSNYVSRKPMVTLNGITTLISPADAIEIIDYYVICWVEYTDSTGAVQLVERGGGDKKIAWNAVAPYHLATNMTTFLDSFIYAAGSFKNLLNWKYYGASSFGDDSIVLKDTDYRSISFFAKTVNNGVNAHRLYVETRTKAGATKRFGLNLNISTSNGVNYRLYHVGMGLPQLNAYTWTTTSIPPGYSSTISATEDAYLSVTIQKYNGSTYDIVSKALLFKITPSSCFNFDHYTVAYQAPYGGFGYINFSKRSDKRNETNMNTYKNILPFRYSLGDRETKVYYNQLKESISLTTDWLYNQLQVDEIMDMLSSPFIYLIDNNYQIIPVTVKTATYDYKKKNQDKLFQYQVDFNYAFDQNVIYR